MSYAVSPCRCARLRCVGVVVLMLATGGCGRSNPPRYEKALREAGLSGREVYPLAGTVTIDGQPPQGGGSLFVVLNDVSKPNAKPNNRMNVQCDAEGKFEFSTVTRGDGAPAGSYIITFAMLKGSGHGFVGPDQLMNLYSDPDTNGQIPEFKIDHKPPGKKDYAFNLAVAGKEPAEPGKYSLRTSD